MSLPDIPFMAFYDHQSTYASTLGIGVPPKVSSGSSTAADLLQAISPHRPEPVGRSAIALPASHLTFRASAAVTDGVRQAVVDSLARHAPARRAELDREFARADVVGQFRKAIASHGYEPLDLAHNVAAFLILQWETVSGSRADEAQMRGTAAQLRRALLARGGALAGMSDAQKQTVADALAYQAVLGVEIARSLQQRGKRDELQQLREGILRTMRTLGWDLDRLSLTPAGLVPR